ncbi:hypothetical protein [Streptomyces sp. NBC_00344]|uniref:hypothetical protein n=1 Tax=Streptomyces sp. NBC_00344 TaxID=2975720 RepID=UPI002E1E9D15
MNTFLDYLTVIAVFVLIALPSLVGHAHERRIDRQLARDPGRESVPGRPEGGSRPPAVAREAAMSSRVVAS